MCPVRQSWCLKYVYLQLEESSDGAIGVQKRAYLENRVKMLEKGVSVIGGAKKGQGEGKTIKKYNNGNHQKGVVNNNTDLLLDDSSEEQEKDKKLLGKKTKQTKSKPKDDDSSEESEVEVVKKKSKRKGSKVSKNSKKN